MENRSKPTPDATQKTADTADRPSPKLNEQQLETLVFMIRGLPYNKKNTPPLAFRRQIVEQTVEKRAKETAGELKKSTESGDS